MCSSHRRTDDTLQILKMVVWRHMVGKTADVVGQAVVGHINHREDIGSADRFIDHCFCLAASKTRAFQVQQIGINVITAVIQIFLSAKKLFDIISPERNDMVIDLSCQIHAAFQCSKL